MKSVHKLEWRKLPTGFQIDYRRSPDSSLSTRRMRRVSAVRYQFGGHLEILTAKPRLLLLFAAGAASGMLGVLNCLAVPTRGWPTYFNHEEEMIYVTSLFWFRLWISSWRQPHESARRTGCARRLLRDAFLHREGSGKIEGLLCPNSWRESNQSGESLLHQVGQLLDRPQFWWRPDARQARGPRSKLLRISTE